MKLHSPVRAARKSTRLAGFDYSQPGVYFVTVVTENRECRFGRIESDLVILSGAGLMVKSIWENLPLRFSNISMDTFVIMPNHIHGLITANEPVAAPLVGAMTGESDPGEEAADHEGIRATTIAAPTLGEIVGAYKSLTTVKYIRAVREKGWEPISRRLWQRNYYEHIVRNEIDLQRARQYILDNPAKWSLDSENPSSHR